MNITISGNLGSGKSTICKVLEKKGFNIVTAGGLFRQIARERGIDVVELMSLQDDSVDELLDTRNKELGQKLDHAVFDSRMAWYFVPDAMKVFVKIDIETAAARIFNDPTRDTEHNETIEDCRENIIRRQELERNRYQSLYGQDIYDLDNYDIIIDGTSGTPEELAEVILTEYEKRSKKTTG